MVRSPTSHLTMSLIPWIFQCLRPCLTASFDSHTRTKSDTADHKDHAVDLGRFILIHTPQVLRFAQRLIPQISNSKMVYQTNFRTKEWHRGWTNPWALFHSRTHPFYHTNSSPAEMKRRVSSTNHRAANAIPKSMRNPRRDDDDEQVSLRAPEHTPGTHLITNDNCPSGHGVKMVRNPSPHKRR